MIEKVVQNLILSRIGYLEFQNSKIGFFVIFDDFSINPRSYGGILENC